MAVCSGNYRNYPFLRCHPETTDREPICRHLKTALHAGIRRHSTAPDQAASAQPGPVAGLRRGEEKAPPLASRRGGGTTARAELELTWKLPPSHRFGAGASPHPGSPLGRPDSTRRRLARPFPPSVWNPCRCWLSACFQWTERRCIGMIRWGFSYQNQPESLQ